MLGHVFPCISGLLSSFSQRFGICIFPSFLLIESFVSLLAGRSFMVPEFDWNSQRSLWSTFPLFNSWFALYKYTGIYCCFFYWITKTQVTVMLHLISWNNFWWTILPDILWFPACLKYIYTHIILQIAFSASSVHKVDKFAELAKVSSSTWFCSLTIYEHIHFVELPDE